MATAVPEMLALHLDEHIEACLIVLVMSMMGTAARYKNTLLMDELRLMSQDIRILIINILVHKMDQRRSTNDSFFVPV